jgi:signal transduction histidine kinase
VALAPEPLELGALVEEVFATLRPMAQAMGVELRLNAGAPVRATSGRQQVRQILEHLVSNAIRFGAGAPVFVRVQAVRGGGVQVEVVDGGPGIAPEDQGRIFDEFVQLARDENGDSAGIEGTGLGLSIARRLARLLGGEIDLSSTVGVGSTFRFTLPDRAAAGG